LLRWVHGSTLSSSQIFCSNADIAQWRLPHFHFTSIERITRRFIRLKIPSRPLSFDNSGRLNFQGAIATSVFVRDRQIGQNAPDQAREFEAVAAARARHEHVRLPARSRVETDRPARRCYRQTSVRLIRASASFGMWPAKKLRTVPTARSESFRSTFVGRQAGRPCRATLTPKPRNIGIP